MTWKPIKPVALSRLIGATNICDLLGKEDLASISTTVQEGYQQDLQSRADWDKRQANANKLALQVMEAKTDPWPNASNVKFPLVTVAATQFASRAYPALFSGTDLVKSRVIGPDSDGSKHDRGERIATHMSWQNLEQDPAWEEDSDKLCLVTPIAGCAFRKRVFEPGPQRQFSMLVLPRHLVVNYWTRSLEDSPRYTHTFYLDSNNIRQRELDGRYRKLPQEEGSLLPEDDANRDGPVRPDAQASSSEQQQATDMRQGITKPQEDRVTPWFTGEQYCWFDFDGDGYEEPYVVTFDIGTGVVRRIVARYLPSGVKFEDGTSLAKHARRGTEEIEYDVSEEAGDVYKITPVKVFTKYGFIPSPDGGFYDLGLGSLLGPINATVNTIINQMLDQGTMYTLGGGFLGRAFKIQGGPITFQPNQWQRTDIADDLRKSIFPNPIKEPSGVLLQLLGLLIQYGERIVSANDIQLGEQDMQNQKAETTRILNENGARVYSGIYKRLWRCARNEYRIQKELNGLYLTADVNYEELTQGRSALIRPDDYELEGIDVCPAADPHIVSDGEAQKQAMTLVQLSQQVPGFNRYRSTLRLLKALKVPNIEEVYPEPKDPQTNQPLPDYPPPPNPKLLAVQQKGAELQLKAKQFQADQVQMKIDTLLEAQESQARIAKMIAETEKLKAETKGAAAEPLIKMLYAQIEAEGKHRDQLLKFAELIQKSMEKTDGAASDAGDHEHGGMAAPQALAGAAALPKGNGAIASGQLGGLGL